MSPWPPRPFIHRPSQSISGKPGAASDCRRVGPIRGGETEVCSGNALEPIRHPFPQLGCAPGEGEITAEMQLRALIFVLASVSDRSGSLEKRWRMIVGISEFLFRSSAVVSPVARSAVSPILKVRRAPPLVAAAETEPTEAPQATGN